MMARYDWHSGACAPCGHIAALRKTNEHKQVRVASKQVKGEINVHISLSPDRSSKTRLLHYQISRQRLYAFNEWQLQFDGSLFP